MTMAGVVAGDTVAAAAQAIKASGVLVTMEPDDFMTILTLAEDPVVVVAPGGWFQRAYHYLTSYRGLAFFTQSDTELPLPQTARLLQAKSIWIP